VSPVAHFPSAPLMTFNRRHHLLSRSRRGSFRRDERGAVLVEFALVLPVLLLLVLGALDFGKAYNYWIDTTHLSAAGARWAAVNNNPGPGATLQQTIRGQANTAELRNGGTDSVAGPVQVCITFPNGGSPQAGDPVRVTVSASYNFLNFIGSRIGIATRPISNSSTMRLEQAPTSYSAGCTS
jgi:Flp pilus assembly protein TadG